MPELQRSGIFDLNKVKSKLHTSKKIIILKISLLVLFLISCNPTTYENEKFASVIINGKSANIEFFWKDDDGKPFKSLRNLKNHVEIKGRRLRFAMNGGMYETGNAPKGLFVQNNLMLVPLDTKDGDGNFYLKPNGVFYLTVNNEAFIVPTENFKDEGAVKFATQSGPMMLVNGEINRAFDSNSVNLNIRNGVCVTNDSKIIFAVSRRKTNFYEFADHFKNLNCRDALYLDGFVSRMYAPEQNIEQLDGDFAVIIGVIE